MDFQDTLDQLNLTIGDTEDVTFTPEAKERALQKAWNDAYVVKSVLDTTTVWATNTWSYSLPATLDTVQEIYITTSTSANEPIDSDLYEVVNGRIIFRNDASTYFSPGGSVVIKGNYKLNYISDTLDTTDLQEYVIATAAYYTLNALKYMKANLFLKNDISVAELMALGNGFDQERKELRAKLPRQFESA